MQTAELLASLRIHEASPDSLLFVAISDRPL